MNMSAKNTVIFTLVSMLASISGADKSISESCPQRLEGGITVNTIVDCIDFLRKELNKTRLELNLEMRRADRLQQEVVSVSVGSIPSGAVVAFDRPSCPTGWVPFLEGEGRMIVGATSERGDPEFIWQRTGGEKSVVLSSDNLPPHSHSISGHAGVGFKAGSRIYARDDDNRAMNTGVTGQSRPINNMPPYIALYFCKKD